MDIKNDYVLTHDCGDFKLTMEFSAESCEDVMRFFSYFLKGCSFADETINQYIPEE